MFAVLKTGGKQYRVTTGDVLRVEKIAAETCDKIQFNEILMVGNNGGLPLVEDAEEQAEVIDRSRGAKMRKCAKRRINNEPHIEAIDISLCGGGAGG